jgi:3-methyladenine DNA glycosylase AlkC
MADTETAAAPALKELINASRLKRVARILAEVAPDVDAGVFQKAALKGLEPLSIMERVRHVAQALHGALPGSYRQQLAVLHELSPRLADEGFLNLALPEFVALHGLDDFSASMDALKAFTSMGTSEFAIRPFLRQDLARTLKVMERWSRDRDEHVRRLASEGCRPRLPWSFRLDALCRDPSPIAPILDNLKADPSLMVRRSVANNLNDITKDHPDWALARLTGWPLDEPHTAWIARHALRSLVKKGDARALKIVGADDSADVALEDLSVSPKRLRIGGEIAISFGLRSTSDKAQRLVVDYAVHYVKKNGSTSPKVFKLKNLTLDAGASESFTKRREVRDFTTRVHHAGRHRVEVLVNGRLLGGADFELTVA